MKTRRSWFLKVVVCGRLSVLIARFRLCRSLLYMSFPTVHLVLIICTPNYAKAENNKQDFPPKVYSEDPVCFTVHTSKLVHARSSRLQLLVVSWITYETKVNYERRITKWLLREGRCIVLFGVVCTQCDVVGGPRRGSALFKEGCRYSSSQVDPWVAAPPTLSCLNLRSPVSFRVLLNMELT